MAAFYEGGVNYADLKIMPVDEFLMIHSAAQTIANERKEAMNGK